MRVKPTDKWTSSIAVPNCGIIRKPFNSKFAEVSDDAGKWLIEAGFAVAAEVEKNVEPSLPLPARVEEPLPVLEKPAEPVKPKKSSKLFVNPGDPDRVGL